MRTATTLLLLSGLAMLTGCSRSPVEIANNDSRALVEAIRAASATPGSDTIRLARNGLYILGSEAEKGLLLPTLGGKIRIEGNGAEIRGYSERPAALLQVEAGAEVSIDSLVLAEGTDGALRNYGELHLSKVGIVDSSVHMAQAIVLNHGRIKASDSEIAYNFLLGNRRDAGTVLNYGEIELDRSRIHDNRAQGRYPSVAVAGGILNFGQVRADGLMLENNELPSDDAPSLSFGGILNMGNGYFKGSTSSGSVRNATQALVAGNF